MPLPLTWVESLLALAARRTVPIDPPPSWVKAAAWCRSRSCDAREVSIPALAAAKRSCATTSLTMWLAGLGGLPWRAETATGSRRSRFERSDDACDDGDVVAGWRHPQASSVDAPLQAGVRDGHGACDYCRYKLRALLFGLRSALVDLRWRHSGCPRAVARSNVEFDSCVPKSAQAGPTYDPVRAPLQTSHVRRRCAISRAPVPSRLKRALAGLGEDVPSRSPCF
jgi:hypothetical protein